MTIVNDYDIILRNEKIVLTYEMKILYCPDIEMNLSCKELNLSTLQFRLYAGNRSDLFTGFELSAEDVTSVARDILMGKIGYELAEKHGCRSLKNY